MSMSPAASVLAEATKTVDTDRRKSYGHPRDNFARTGVLWGAVLDASGRKPGEPVSPELVGLMMVCLKIDRQAFGHKRDNLVDIAGYAACIAECVNEPAA